MDDLFLKRVLFEWLRDRQKEQTHAEIVSLKEIKDCMANLVIFQRLIPVLSLRTLATSSRGLKKDYPWSDYLEKLPDPADNYRYYTNPKILGHAGTARLILSFLKKYNDV